MGTGAWGAVAAWLNDLLWQPVGFLFGAPVSVVEVIGFVSGAVCVWLVGRQNQWNWPIGLIQVVAYLFLFWSAGLYADAGLQAVYIGLGLWGWWNWLRGRPEGQLRVRRARSAEWLVLAGVGVAGTVLIAQLLISFTSSTVPWPDAATTVLSLLATHGQGRKLLESWWLWLAADLVYIPLYAYKGLWLTSLLYTVFLALCVIGLLRWQGALAPAPQPAAVTA
jgi:nicotinamide mononucleotide transporter